MSINSKELLTPQPSPLSAHFRDCKLHIAQVMPVWRDIMFEEDWYSLRHISIPTPHIMPFEMNGKVNFAQQGKLDYVLHFEEKPGDFAMSVIATPIQTEAGLTYPDSVFIDLEMTNGQFDLNYGIIDYHQNRKKLPTPYCKAKPQPPYTYRFTTDPCIRWQQSVCTFENGAMEEHPRKNIHPSRYGLFEQRFIYSAMAGGLPGFFPSVEGFQFSEEHFDAHSFFPPDNANFYVIPKN